MNNAESRLAALGAAVPELLFPRKGIDLSKWAVIACDQGTQDRPYWEQVRSIAGDAPSSLNLIYPEVYLEEPDKKERITAIHHTMNHYLENDIFTVPQKTLVYLERDTPFHQSRRGLLAALDLEAYDWKADTSLKPPLIRPTEGTLPERLPSRMKIRCTAPLETPHILVLLDDEENTLLPALAERAFSEQTKKLFYDTELMLGSGHVRGWKLDEEDDWEFLAAGLEKLAKKAAEKYGTPSAQTPFLFAVGDGNHSLAAAKGVWEEYKTAQRNDPNIMNHPARWALVELENLYDPALSFEPIHRLLFGTDTDSVQQLLAQLPGYSCRKTESASELEALVRDENCDLLRLGLVSPLHCFLIEAWSVPLAVDVLQPLLDKYIEEQNGKVQIDYIHGSEELFRLTGRNGESSHVGILLPPFRKQGLFETVAKRGPLPRKSFSMGESCEKRFYLECRKLFN